MDFTLTHEQSALGQSVRRFLAEEYSFARRRSISASAAGWSREIWNSLAELGVLGITAPEQYGGLGLGALEISLVMEAFGECLVLEPYWASAVVATALLRELGGEQVQAEWLPRLVNGQTVCSLAHFEPLSRYATRYVTTRAEASSEGYVLNGRKAMVECADCADVFLVSARLSGAAHSPSGVCVFAVPRVCPGMRVSTCRLLDGKRGGELELDAVALPSSARLDGQSGALMAIERALDFGLAALCAEAVGVMQALLDATVAYLKTRHQFGRPIGTFQALQHRAADMLIELEQSRSMSLLAVMNCTERNERLRRRILSAAKVTINRAARFISQQAVQLHGGIGMTDELPVGHWFKRLASIEMTLGDTDTHLREFTSAAS